MYADLIRTRFPTYIKQIDDLLDLFTQPSLVEVRDSRTGYFIPGRYGLGIWPDTKIVGASPPPSSASVGFTGGLSPPGPPTLLD